MNAVSVCVPTADSKTFEPVQIAARICAISVNSHHKLKCSNSDSCLDKNLQIHTVVAFVIFNKTR